MLYDRNNIFYKIINKELSAEIILEEKYFIVIDDICPKATVHMLVIPKGEYIDYYDFVMKASEEEIVEVMRGVAKVVDMRNLKDDGYKFISNSKMFGEQEVMHVHFHVLGAGGR